MANLYGPMAFKPNPGISLNSSPQFQMPAAPAAAPVHQSMPQLPSMQDWLKENNLRRGGTNADRGSRSIGGPSTFQSQQRKYQNAMLGQMLSSSGMANMFGGGAMSGAPAPSAGGSPGGMDAVAAAYARFLNGGV